MPFYQIYKKTGEGYKAVKTIMGNQYLGEMSIEDFSKDGRKQLVIWSSGGAHHADLYIYEWLNGDYKRIFEDGSACGIQTDFKATPPMIKIGKEKWNTEGWSYVDEPGWEIWLWDGEKFNLEKI